MMLFVPNDLGMVLRVGIVLEDRPVSDGHLDLVFVTEPSGLASLLVDRSDPVVVGAVEEQAHPSSHTLCLVAAAG